MMSMVLLFLAAAPSSSCTGFRGVLLPPPRGAASSRARSSLLSLTQEARTIDQCGAIPRHSESILLKNIRNHRVYSTGA